MLIQEFFSAFNRRHNSAANDGLEQLLFAREVHIKCSLAHASPGGNILQPGRSKPAFDN
jgi:hypothetical protein